jgi:hypothetical protein
MWDPRREQRLVKKLTHVAPPDRKTPEKDQVATTPPARRVVLAAARQQDFRYSLGHSNMIGFCYEITKRKYGWAYRPGSTAARQLLFTDFSYNKITNITTTYEKLSSAIPKSAHTK